MRTVETSPQSTPQTFQMIPHGAYRMTSCAANRMVEATLEWVSPASRTPALLMVAVPRDSELFECLAESGRATLHVVTGSDEPAAARLIVPAGVRGGPAAALPLVTREGATTQQDLPVRFECELDRLVYIAGDHVVAILRVIESAGGRGVRTPANDAAYGR